MKTGTLLKVSFIAVVVITAIGAAMKIIHMADADTVLILALIAQLVFIVTAIYEVATSNRIRSTEKWMWSIALIFFGGLTGLIYLLVGRTKVVAEQ